MNRGFMWAAAAIAIAIAGGIFWWRYGRVDALPAYLARANGRLEMTRIDIAVKYPRRLVDLSIHEGDDVQAGMILAQQDEAEIQAQIAGAEAPRQRAFSAIARADAELVVRPNGQQLARLEWSQAASMHGKALVSQVELQRRRIALEVKTASTAAADYEKAVLAALEDVENAYGRGRGLDQRGATLAAALANATRDQRASTGLYEGGSKTFGDARLDAFEREDEPIQMQMGQAAATVHLYRALGGDRGREG